RDTRPRLEADVQIDLGVLDHHAVQQVARVDPVGVQGEVPAQVQADRTLEVDADTAEHRDTEQIDVLVERQGQVQVRVRRHQINRLAAEEVLEVIEAGLVGGKLQERHPDAGVVQVLEELFHGRVGDLREQSPRPHPDLDAPIQRHVLADELET